MSSILDKLSPKDKQVLALFYETESYTVLKKLMGVARKNAAHRCLTATDFLEVKYLQGQESALKLLQAEIEKVYQHDQKR